MSLSVSLAHDFGGFCLNASFEAPQGLTAIFGPSGSGKTSIVNALSGLLTPQQGRIVMNDAVFLDTSQRLVMPVHKRRLGYVFQDARLFPHMNVARNLDFGRRAQRLPKSKETFEQVLALLGLEGLLLRAPNQLSGGEKQRVAIGRALLSHPQLLLLDEPLAALDEARKQEIMPYLERLRDVSEIPILYVSHSVSEVARLATTVVAIQNGKVLRAGPAAQVFADPEAVPALGDAAAGAILEAKVTAHHADGMTELSVDGARLFLPQIAAQPGSALRVRVRAQDVMLSLSEPQGVSALNIIHGHISALSPGQNAGVWVQIRCGSQVILSRVTQRSATALQLAQGMPIYAVIKSVSVAQNDIGAVSSSASLPGQTGA
ncbi:molybdenum ABC transporter ATP-binding protein [Cognatishimia sp. WU-CL00825]|uniref:molybdenum ABC transporter ATP-binding protein n=1 Tax=Cognatishimia sp. WU-CL00825 TaxID=3127658 RepID=UPI00310C3B97